MAREFFKDLPNTTTPLTASRLNGLLNGDEALGSIVVDDVSCKNIFDWSVGGDAGQYLKNDGTTAYSGDNLRFTDYIKIDATKSNLTISGMTNTLQNPAICFYDSNKTFISGQALGGGLTKTVSIPSTAVYIRCSYRNINPETMIEYGTTATEYAEYKNFDSTIEKINVTSSYTLNVQGCFARGDEININLNVFNDSSYSTGSWVEIAQLPSGYHPDGERYLSAYGCGSGWNTPISVPVLITSNGKINIYIVTSNIKRIVVSGSFLKTL